MPVREIILKVFVSSPSDVKGERLAVIEIIEEINSAWATFLGIRLEAIRWETHCRPGVGSDSQQVINEQLPTDCDKDLADCFTLQSKRYSERILSDDDLLQVPEFRASEQRMQKVHSVFSEELNSAAKILREAQRITETLAANRKESEQFHESHF